MSMRLAFHGVTSVVIEPIGSEGDTSWRDIIVTTNAGPEVITLFGPREVLEAIGTPVVAAPAEAAP